MNITFLIGNGFDLGLGLDTSYPAFINWYLKQEASENPILQEFKNHIEQNKETWGDAELAFGQLPFSQFGDSIKDSIRICLSDFQEKLCEYLRLQEERFDKNAITPKLRREFRLSLVSLLHSFIVKYPDLFSLPTGAPKTKQVNVINFNYTSTFDWLLKDDITTEITLRLTKGHSYNATQIPYVQFNNCVHVHGELLKPADVLFGVNDCTQICDPELLALGEQTGYIIKPRMAQDNRSSFYASAEKILNNTEVLVLFGLSYGKSDQTWWNKILNKIRLEKMFLILCPYELSPIKANSYIDKDFIAEKEIEKFLRDFQSVQEDAVIELKRQISVLTHGPYQDLEVQEAYYCDPLHLNYFGRHCVKDFNREPIRTARQY